MPEIKKSTGFSKSPRLAGSSKPASQAPGGGSQRVDLAKLFGAVAGTMADNRQSLNKADTTNRNHGDNMVAIFQAVTAAMEQKKGATPSAQLLQASKSLASQQSGSAQLYASGLAQAARQFQGQKQLTPASALPLVQSLLGGGQPQGPAQGDMAAGLLGALLGGGQAQPQQESGAGDLLGALLGGGQAQPQPQQGGAGDLLGALLGGGQAASSQGPAGAELLGALMGGTDAQGQHQVDTAQLLNAGLNIGMAYLAAKQQGSSNGQALINALLRGSAVGQSAHRSQSGALVADTILSVLGGMTQKK